MKRYRYLLLLLLVPTLVVMGVTRTRSGDAIQPAFTTTPQSLWEELGPLTVQQAYPAVGNRDATAIDAVAEANMVGWDVPNDASGFMMMVETSADADAQVLEILVAAGDTQRNGVTDDNYLYGGTLTLTGGTQTGSNSNVFCDTCTTTDGVLSLTALDGAGNNRVAVVTGDTRGFKRFKFCTSTLAAKTEVYIFVRFW